MAFERDFLDMMSASVTIKPYASFGGYGDEAYGTTTVVPAKITIKSAMNREDKEEFRSVHAVIIIPPPGFVIGGVTVPTLSVRDHIILPDGTDRRILDLNAPYDEDGGYHHQEVNLA